MIIDAHIHLWPPEVGLDPVGWGQAHGESRFAAMMEPPVVGVSSEWPTLATVDREMVAAGVDGAVVLGWYWERPPTCVRQTDWLAMAIGAKHPRLTWCAPFHAGGGEAAFDRVRRAIEEEGARGIGEIFPTAQGYGWRDPWLERLLDWAATGGWPVVLHVTEPVGPDWPGRVETPLPEIVDLAAAHPGLPLVLAHWGGGLPWYAQSPVVGRALASSFYDTAAAPRLGLGQAWKAGLAAAGAERVLWGSDYPLRLYRGQTAAAGWARWRQESATEADLSVLGETAAKLFRWRPS